MPQLVSESYELDKDHAKKYVMDSYMYREGTERAEFRYLDWSYNFATIKNNDEVTKWSLSHFYDREDYYSFTFSKEDDWVEVDVKTHDPDKYEDLEDLANLFLEVGLLDADIVIFPHEFTFECYNMYDEGLECTDVALISPMNFLDLLKQYKFFYKQEPDGPEYYDEQWQSLGSSRFPLGTQYDIITPYNFS